MKHCLGQSWSQENGTWLKAETLNPSSKCGTALREDVEFSGKIPSMSNVNTLVKPLSQQLIAGEKPSG